MGLSDNESSWTIVDMFSEATASPTKTETAQNSLLAAIRVWGLILLTLHLAAYHLPEETAWSLWPYTFLPPWLGWLLALAAGALIIPSINLWAWAGLERLWLALPIRQARRRWFAAAALWMERS